MPRVTLFCMDWAGGSLLTSKKCNRHSLYILSRVRAHTREVVSFFVSSLSLSLTHHCFPAATASVEPGEWQIDTQIYCVINLFSLGPFAFQSIVSHVVSVRLELIELPVNDNYYTFALTPLLG